jgi:hypothetical protein
VAIRTVITRGYGNGTFNGTVGLVVTRGYTSKALAAVTPKPISLEGVYMPTVELEGQHRATVELEGTHKPTVELEGIV